MDLLNRYNSDDESPNHSASAKKPFHSSIPINSAPAVELTTTDIPLQHNHTITLQQNITQSRKNHFIGHVERVALDSASFDLQYTKAIANTHNKRKLHTDNQINRTQHKTTVTTDKTKYNVHDIDGFQGSWGVLEPDSIQHNNNNNESEHTAPSTTTTITPPQPNTIQYYEPTVLHLNTAYDYQNRSYLFTPTSIHIPSAPVHCYAPKQLLHTYNGHTAEVNRIQYIGQSGHLFISASNDTTLRIWSTVNKDILPLQSTNKQCIRSISAHTKGIRDIQLNSTHTHVASASYDKHVKIFDLETGACIHRIKHDRTPNCVAYCPSSDHELIMGMSDKSIQQYDIRSDTVVQTYKEHMGAVNSVTFIDPNTFISTGDDKRIYSWEYGIPVTIGALSDPDMHSIPCITLHPNKQQFIGQSQDNTIRVFNIQNGKVKLNRKKLFKGHLSAGYSCHTTISTDGEMVASGDAQGRLFVWNYSTTKKLKQLSAHTQVCIDTAWHPIESSKLLTCSWDGTVKLWD